MHAIAAVRPAVIGNRNKVARRKAVLRADLAAEKRDRATETHGPNAQCVRIRHHFRFQIRKFRNRVYIFLVAEELFFGMGVAAGAVAADGYTDEPGAAALTLGLVDGVEDTLVDAIQVAVGPANLRQLLGERILNILVLAAAALEEEQDLDIITLPLFKMNDRRPRTEIQTRVSPGDTVHGIWAELAGSSGFGNGLMDGILSRNLVHADRAGGMKRRHAGILADRLDTIRRHVDVLVDNCQRLLGLRAIALGGCSPSHYAPNVRGPVRGG